MNSQLKIPDSTIALINEKLDITDVIGEYVVLERKGNSYKGLCPFHNEKTPSFNVDREKGVYYCFGCHKGGGIIQFVMDIEQLTFPEAVRILAEKADIPIGLDHPASPQMKQKDALIELYSRVSKSFHYLLMESPQAERARIYLAKRKLSLDTLKAFQVGYAPLSAMWLSTFLEKKGYSKGFLKESGLFSRKNPNSAFFRNRIMFPISNFRGRIIAFGGRQLDDFGPKYLNSPDTQIFKKGHSVFGLNAAIDEIKKKKECFLVEGYMDVLALYEAGIVNAVAPLGTAFTEEQAGLLKRYCKKITIIFDGDEAGRRAVLKAAAAMEKNGIECTVIPLDEGEDPADILENRGPGELKFSQKNSINVLEFLINSTGSQWDLETPEGKEFVLQELFPYIESIGSPVKRDGALSYVSDRIGVSYKAVIEDYRRRQRGQTTKDTNNELGLIRRKISIELFLTLAVSANREYFTFVRNYLSVDDFQDEKAKEIFIALEECYRRDEKTIEALLNRLENEELKRLVCEKASTDEFKMNSEQVVVDTVKRIRQKSLEKKRTRVDSLLKRTRTEQNEDSIVQVKELLEEKMYLDKEFEKLKVLKHD